MADGSFRSDAGLRPAQVAFRALWPAPTPAAAFTPLHPQELAVLPAPAPPPPQPEPEPEPEAPCPEPPPAPEPPPLSAAPDPALVQAHEAGRLHGRAEAEAELAAERDHLAQTARALAGALAALAQPRPEDVAGLAGLIDRAVARLASARAGQAIDAAPAPFARRIARLAETLAQHQEALTLHLHPQDLAAIQPLLAGTCPADLVTLATARLVADPALSRGDSDLRAPGLRLADLADPEPLAPG